MRQLGWITLALLFTGLSVLLVAWPDLRDLRRGQNWNVAGIDGDTGELNGVTVSIDQARAMIFPAMPDRAVL